MTQLINGYDLAKEKVVAQNFYAFRGLSRVAVAAQGFNAEPNGSLGQRQEAAAVVANLRREEWRIEK